ncbi:hypothetical protein V5N11_028464 [Cardamine amara subsp. amara]|uniref:Uncharacterized protein n=1 Tax=Cardamine amara subsp. amara TaxID=228776 RepID=A0ABD1BPA1_CARAN
MARNHQFRSHLFLNEFEMSTGGGFNSLSRRNHRDMYTSEVVNTLSDQFSSMSLLRPKPRLSPSLPSSLQSLRPKLDPFYEIHLSMVRKNESQQDRAEFLQRQETRLHKGGLVHQNPNALKESVGTGVFHPLQRPTPKTVNSAKKSNQRNWNQSEKESLSKERRVLSTAQEQENEECHYHLPSDMDFSKDWTF